MNNKNPSLFLDEDLINKAALSVAEKMSKELAPDVFVIFNLCHIYEHGTENKITLESIMDEKGVFNFIKATLPLLKMMGEIIDVSLDDETIRFTIGSYVALK